MNKSFKVRLYPNKIQERLINQTIGNCRFLYNQMLNERIEVYENLKNNKKELYDYKYKTEKEYKGEFEWLSLGSSRALQQSRINLEQAYKNFYRKIKQNKKGKKGFPKFKSKNKSKLSYREPNINNIEIKNNKIKLLKLGWVKFRGLSDAFNGVIKNVTIEKSKSNKYFALILTESKKVEKQKKDNKIIGIDLGLKEFITISDGRQLNGIQDKVKQIDKKIKKQHRILSRKIRINKKNNIKDSKRKEKCRIRLNKLYEYKKNFLNHFQWHLSNYLCSESQAISIENLNVSGMKRNRKLSGSIHNVNWSSFVSKLEQKAKEYDTIIYKVGRFYPSSKTCSRCGRIKEYLTLADRIYKCECGFVLDRDLNASINIYNEYLRNSSMEYIENSHRETVRPIKIIYNFKGSFDEVIKDRINK